MLSARPGGPVPTAATDAVMLTNQWMGRVVDRLVELYGHAPWQVGQQQALWCAACAAESMYVGDA